MTKSGTRNPNETRNPNDQLVIRYWSFIRDSLRLTPFAQGLSLSKAGSVIRAFLAARPISIICCTVMLGCADTKTPSASDRQDAALRDPFGYSPNMPNKNSGGGLTEFDKQGFKHDVDRVLNP